MKIAILGSTGSIGKQTLEIARAYPERYEIVALAAGSNRELVAEQAREFEVKRTAMAFDGAEGVLELATLPEVDVVVMAIVGFAALEPTLAALKAGKRVALANKECLVAGGQLVMEAMREGGGEIIPVDSEHSALFQCLQGSGGNGIRRLILTASGGPFFRKSAGEMAQIGVADALAHPTWKMGAKVTIDSSTLMNKGLEVIEAHWLFGIPLDQIEVVIHPQSIIHSMVEFDD